MLVSSHSFSMSVCVFVLTAHSLNGNTSRSLEKYISICSAKIAHNHSVSLKGKEIPTI